MKISHNGDTSQLCCGVVHFQIDEPGASQLKAYGKSKYKLNDLQLVTIGLALTPEGIPVKCWILPGNQQDAKSIDQIPKDPNAGKIGLVVWVMDRGMVGDKNRHIHQRANGQCILGEILRGNRLSEQLLNRGGRFKVVAQNLHVKEVHVGEGLGRRHYMSAYNRSRPKMTASLMKMSCNASTVN